jgi:carbamate kinase
LISIWEQSGGPPVVAFGGNALLPDANDPEAAEANAAEFAVAMAALLPHDTGLVLVHGNGPQVGAALLRVEAAAGEAPPLPLDVLVAETQGSIGYQLSRALESALKGVEVTTQITRVVVDPGDPAMVNPTKPVGPYYGASERERLEARGWRLVDVPDRGLRRLVPSPLPIEVVEIDSIASAAAPGRIVIAGGGGGIPVTDTDGGLIGVEGVIDKDRTGALIARLLESRGFLILTEVGHVSQGFGSPGETPLLEMDADTARRLLREGEFPPGSMGPKVEAAVAFAEATGRSAMITSVTALPDALEGEDGTRVVP